MLKQRIQILSIVSILLIASFMYLISEANADAPSRIIVSTVAEAAKIGNEFETTPTITRSELNTFLDEVKRGEQDANLLNSIRFGIAATVVTLPLKIKGLTITAGGASSLLSFFIINKDLGSSTIQNVLNKSTATKFELKIKYKKKTRGAWDVWYEAQSVQVTPK
ncbi:hypothetical protein LAV72_12450 [Lysinibacillus xylanilyticus]|uniref:hypothetical protein n=1 Tax=Lysinibacillus xylanilyticus TaxID=582475 RepID=UPI002B242F3B|nr:hypothetical protein [Lysinibacillus xylanilyticus]MEB2300426.1 hypothetical protein [Lysinibacillus xylanilyticus]